MTDLSRPAPQAQRRGLLLVFVGGVLYASAGLFTRALPFDPWTLLAWRSLAGGLFTAAVLAGETRRLSWRDYAMSPAHWALVPVTALASIAYILALTMTTVAEVMIVYATSPFVTAAVAWAWNREAPTRRLLIASSAALAGVALMLGGGGALAPGRVLGAALVLVMNLGFAWSLVLARRHPGQSMMPSNTLALLLASAAGFALSPGEPLGTAPWLLMLLFGVVTVGFAMTLFMVGARVAPSAEVSLVGISDVVLGPLMVYLAFGENPGAAAVAGGGVVIAALLWNLWPELKRILVLRQRII